MSKDHRDELIAKRVVDPDVSWIFLHKTSDTHYAPLFNQQRDGEILDLLERGAVVAKRWIEDAKRTLGEENETA